MARDFEGFIRAAIQSFDQTVLGVVKNVNQWPKLARGWLIPGVRTAWYMLLHDGEMIVFHLKRNLKDLVREIEVKEVFEGSPEYEEILQTREGSSPTWPISSGSVANSDNPVVNATWTVGVDPTSSTVIFDVVAASGSCFTRGNGSSLGKSLAERALEEIVVIQQVEILKETITNLQHRHPSDIDNLKELEVGVLNLSERLREAESQLRSFRDVEEYRSVAWIKSKLDMMNVRIESLFESSSNLREFVEFAKDSISAIQDQRIQGRTGKWTIFGVWVALIIGTVSMLLQLWDQLTKSSP